MANLRIFWRLELTDMFLHLLKDIKSFLARQTRHHKNACALFLYEKVLYQTQLDAIGYLNQNLFE